MSPPVVLEDDTGHGSRCSDGIFGGIAKACETDFGIVNMSREPCATGGASHPPNEFAIIGI